jgi:membrane protein DedA with SNARE-associated domain
LAFVVGITLLITLNRERMGDFEALGYAGAFFAMLISNATLILPAPGLIIVFALGSSLNPALVGLAGALGATIGELTGYITGYSGLAILENTGVAQRIHQWMNRNGSLTIFALSIFPNPFFDLAGVMAGAGRMPVWKFLLFAFLGKTIQSTTIALAGALSLNWVEQWLR